MSWKKNFSVVFEYLKKSLSENILIKAIAIIVTMTLFLVVKTNKFTIESVWFKTVPVREQKVGTSPEGQAVHTIIEPKVVRIQGSQSLIQHIDEVRTELIDISSRTHHSSIYIKIDTQNQPISISPESVKVTFIISPK
ncbi:MAG: YbbR-like domain-containing protein [Deltaproteobacteria bacterium]|nr:YbbR-like domain-containing protein [Deltaproteobacteria bacterium]